MMMIDYWDDHPHAHDDDCDARQLGGRGGVPEAAKAFRCEAGGGKGCQDQGDCHQPPSS